MSKICKKRVHGNEKMNLPCAFKKSPFYTTTIFFLQKLNRDVSLTLKSFSFRKYTNHWKNHPFCKFRETSTVEHVSLQAVFLFYLNILKFIIALWMGSTTNNFLWSSCFTTILSQCRGSPWYQMQSKIAGTEILLILETLNLPEVAAGGVL